MSDAHVPWPITMIGEAADASAERIGVKGWYLERLEAAGFSTAPGFVVEADAFIDAIGLARVDAPLARIWGAAGHASPTEIATLARKARHLISTIEFSRGFRECVQTHLDELAARRTPNWAREELRVAVRSSSTPGSVSGPECAGVHTTYLGVVGVDRVLARIHSCWASLFSERALSMRAHGLGDGEPAMAVIVQTMIDAEKSGVLIPTGADDEVLVEATFGLGEPIASGAVEPDRYVIEREVGAPRFVSVGRKQIVLRGRPDSDGHEFAEPDHLRARVLDDAELGELGRLSASIDRLLTGPHEVEWSIDPAGVRVLQARRITPAHHLDSPLVEQCVNGIGIGHGWATGPVRIVERYEDLADLRDGEILVAKGTSPEWLPFITRSAAVVTEGGDVGSHAARVAIELGLPAIVSAANATSELTPGMVVTVDARRGWVAPTRSFTESE